MAENSLHEYELVYILQPDIIEDSLMNMNDRVGQIVASHDGEIINTEIWGRRTLAYPIQNFFEGHYILHRFQMDPEGTAEVDRYLRFNEDVIRFLLLRANES